MYQLQNQTYSVYSSKMCVRAPQTALLIKQAEAQPHTAPIMWQWLLMPVNM